jgi:glycosyltransferase involved in cell wall biosynthesis
MKSKILYIHHAGELGGAPKSLSILLNGLDKNYFIPHVFMLINGPARELFLKEKVEVTYSKWRLFAFHGTTVSGMSFKLFIKNILHVLPNIFAAFKIINKVKPDIIHLNTSCLFVYGMVAKIFFKEIKVISHIREPLLDNIHGKVLKFFNRTFVDFFIPINNFESEAFLGKPLEVIKNSIDKNLYKFDISIRYNERSKMLLGNSSFIIGFFARFTIENGIEDLLKICQRLKILDKDIKILIFGFEPNILTENIKIIAKSIPDNVILNGMVNNVHNKMQIIDLLISPFKTPHFSRSIIEAQSLSIPVIVSNVSSQNTLFENEKTGFSYDFGNIEEAVLNILKLKNDKGLYESMKTNSRIYAEANFCHKNNNQKVYNIYNKLIKKEIHV